MALPKGLGWKLPRQKLQVGSSQVLDLRGRGINLHALLSRGNARGLRLCAPFDVNDAEPACADRFKPRIVAERRNVKPAGADGL